MFKQILGGFFSWLAALCAMDYEFDTAYSFQQIANWILG